MSILYSPTHDFESGVYNSTVKTSWKWIVFDEYDYGDIEWDGIHDCS
jgi:hypothetical protein